MTRLVPVGVADTTAVAVREVELFRVTLLHVTPGTSSNVAPARNPVPVMAMSSEPPLKRLDVLIDVIVGAASTLSDEVEEPALWFLTVTTLAPAASFELGRRTMTLRWELVVPDARPSTLTLPEVPVIVTLGLAKFVPMIGMITLEPVAATAVPPLTLVMVGVAPVAPAERAWAARNARTTRLAAAISSASERDRLPRRLWSMELPIGCPPCARRCQKKQTDHFPVVSLCFGRGACRSDGEPGQPGRQRHVVIWAK